MRALALIAIALSVVACSGAQRPKPVSGASCPLAGKHLRDKGCKEAATPKGVPFETVCENAAKHGYAMPIDCIVNAESCAAAAVCR